MANLNYKEDGYDVVIKQNEVSNKLELKGMYRLVISSDDVELRTIKSKQEVIKWPLHLLRGYGPGKQEFILEAGRRCPSGPGMFYFITDHYNKIDEELDEKVRDFAKRGRTQSTSMMKPPSVSQTSLFRTSNPPGSSSPFGTPVYNREKIGDDEKIKKHYLPSTLVSSSQVEDATYSGDWTSPGAMAEAKPSDRFHFEATKRFLNTRGDDQYSYLIQNWKGEGGDPRLVTTRSINQDHSESSDKEEEQYVKMHSIKPKRFLNTRGDDQYSYLNQNWKGEGGDPRLVTTRSINQDHSEASDKEEEQYVTMRSIKPSLPYRPYF